MAKLKTNRKLDILDKIFGKPEYKTLIEWAMRALRNFSIIFVMFLVLSTLTAFMFKDDLVKHSEEVGSDQFLAYIFANALGPALFMVGPMTSNRRVFRYPALIFAVWWISYLFFGGVGQNPLSFPTPEIGRFFINGGALLAYLTVGTVWLELLFRTRPLSKNYS